LSRSTFATLFAVIGTTYGAVSGSTFSLPDLLGITVRGADNIVPLGSTGGSDNITLSGSQLPSHVHTITDPGHTHDVRLTGMFNNGDSGSGIVYAGQGLGGTAGARTTDPNAALVTTTGISATNAAGSGASISVANSYLALNYMIKVA
jgi:microcystin-dependent protein